MNEWLAKLMGSSNPLDRQTAQDHMLHQVNPDALKALYADPRYATPMMRLKLLAANGIIDDAQAYAQLHGVQDQTVVPGRMGQGQMAMPQPGAAPGIGQAMGPGHMPTTTHDMRAGMDGAQVAAETAYSGLGAVTGQGHRIGGQDRKRLRMAGNVPVLRRR